MNPQQHARALAATLAALLGQAARLHGELRAHDAAMTRWQAESAPTREQPHTFSLPYTAAVPQVARVLTDQLGHRISAASRAERAAAPAATTGSACRATIARITRLLHDRAHLLPAGPFTVYGTDEQGQDVPGSRVQVGEPDERGAFVVNVAGVVVDVLPGRTTNPSGPSSTRVSLHAVPPVVRHLYPELTA